MKEIADDTTACEEHIPNRCWASEVLRTLLGFSDDVGDADDDDNTLYCGSRRGMALSI